MKHLILFENWMNEFTKKGAQDWITKNSDKIREINKKENTLGEFLTKEEQDFMDKYISMYDKVHSKEKEEFYKDSPLSHKGKTYKERRKSFDPSSLT